MENNNFFKNKDSIWSNGKFEADFEILNGLDKRMRFRNAKDPVYVAFDYYEKQSLSFLIKSNLKDLIDGIILLFTNPLKLVVA